jgi:hypothetical protein
MYQYFRMICNGSEKIVRTNSRGCEIYLKSPMGNRYEKFAKPYPISDEEEYEVLNHSQFLNALARLDFDFNMSKATARV